MSKIRCLAKIKNDESTSKGNKQNLDAVISNQSSCLIRQRLEITPKSDHPSRHIELIIKV